MDPDYLIILLIVITKFMEYISNYPVENYFLKLSKYVYHFSAYAENGNLDTGRRILISAQHFCS